MKPTPLIEETGTSVERIRPDSVKNSVAPERNWLSISVSEPSWLFGKIWISTRPLVSCLMRSIASTARTLSGCAVGELLAYLSWNSAAPLAIHGIAIVAPAAVPASRTARRFVLSVIANSSDCVRRGAFTHGPWFSSWAGAARTASGAALSNRGGTVHGEFASATRRNRDRRSLWHRSCDGEVPARGGMARGGARSRFRRARHTARRARRGRAHRRARC